MSPNQTTKSKPQIKQKPQQATKKVAKPVAPVSRQPKKSSAVPVPKPVNSQENGKNVPTKTISNVLGEIVWLMARSVNHRYFFISDMEWMVMQPIALGQYRLFYSENHPVGVALWASVNEDVEKRLKKGINKLSPQDWNSGDRLWLIDLISPFGNVETMLDDLKQNMFKDKVFKYIQRNEKGELMIRSSKQKYTRAENQQVN